MIPLVAPPSIKPAASPQSLPTGETPRRENGRYAAAMSRTAEPSPAALAALAMLGGKPAVASRMEARRIARKMRDEKENLFDDEPERATASVVDLPLFSSPIPKPRIDVEVELAAVREARRRPRRAGPLTAFLAQQFGQSGSLTVSLSAPLKWLINAYVARHVPETPAPKRQTLTVS
jgi:hypothetical protein